MLNHRRLAFTWALPHLNRSEYRKAIDNLNNYRGDDVMIAAEALGNTRRRFHVELKDYSNAASYFKRRFDKGE